MAAGQGFKTFTTGEVLSAADVNGYLMQGVLVFASAAARDAAITSPQEGQFAYLKDTNVTTYYTGSAWANLDTTGMTNPMTTTGDTIYSSSGSTPARLAIGTTGQVLTVAGGVPTWASAGSAAQSWTLLNSGNTATTSGTAITWTGLSGYNHIKIMFDNITITGGAGNTLRLRFNGDDTFKYERFGNNFRWTTTYDRQQFNGFGGVDDCYRIAVYEDNTASALSGGLTVSGANSTATKMVNYTGGATAFNGGTNMNMRITDGRYLNTSVISSITITPDGSRSFTGGNAYIYGAQ